MNYCMVHLPKEDKEHMESLFYGVSGESFTSPISFSPFCASDQTFW